MACVCVCVRTRAVSRSTRRTRKHQDDDVVERLLFL
jgi:hypothetical protein